MSDPNSEVKRTAAELLKAAYAFFDAKKSARQHGGVAWVEFENGEVIIFTRGEYRERLMMNIEPHWPVVDLSERKDAKNNRESLPENLQLLIQALKADGMLSRPACEIPHTAQALKYINIEPAKIPRKL